MAWGTVKVGRLSLREALTPAAESIDTSTMLRTLTITGQEASPDLTSVALAASQDDVHGLYGSLVPVVFTSKTDRNGYYRVSSAAATLNNWTGEVLTCDWSLQLERVGADTEADVESRLAGSLTRNTSFAATGDRTHAPSIGHYAYWAGTTQPSTVSRSSSDGTMTVYRGVSTTVNPRWGCPVGSYLNGRCRFIDANSLERTGSNFTVASSGWTLHNGLVQVQLLSGVPAVMSVASWTSGAWAAKGWDLQISAGSLGVPDTTTVIRNDPEMVILRLLWDYSPAPGRVTADLVLRRGSRLLEIYLQSEFSTTLKVKRQATEASTSGTGYIRATSNDASGNRFVLGSAQAFTGDTTNGAISKSSTTTMDAFIAVELAGSSAVSGDQAAQLHSQYLGMPSEAVRGVRR
jgi:hypothetical protein